MPRSRVIAASSVAFLAAGIGFGSPSLLVPGFALLFGVVGLGAWVRLARARLRVRSARGPWSVTEGQNYPLRVSIEGARIPVPGARLEHPGLPEPVPVPGVLPAGSKLTLEVEMPRRGYQRLEPPMLVLADPFGLHRAAVPGPAATPVMVLPRIEPVEAEFRIGGGGERAAAVVPGTGGSGIDWRSIDFEIDGLRPYRDGTPASRIHWPTVARAGELVERRLTGGGEALPAIVLDSSDPPDSESLDMAVRAAASLCAHMAARGGCLLALPGERRARRVVDPGGWRDAHAALALVGEGPLCPAAASLAARTACLISASAGPPAAGPARVAGCFVSPAPRPGLRTLLTVAGCHLQVERSRPSAAVAA